MTTPRSGLSIRVKVKKALDLGARSYDEIQERFPELKDRQIKKALQHWKEVLKKEGSFIPILHRSSKGTSSNPTFPIGRSVLDETTKRYGQAWGTLIAFLLSSGLGACKPMVSALILAACHPDNITKVQDGSVWDKKLAPATVDLLDECPYGLILTSECKSRTVYDLDLDEDLVVLAWNDSDLVDGFTRKPWAPEEREVLASAQPEIEKLRQALNSQNVDYSQYRKRLELCFVRTSSYRPGPRLHQQAILRQLKTKMDPKYSAKKNTARLYSVGASLQNLNRELRSILFEGETMLDLSHCQFSVIAKIWDLPDLAEYARDGLWGPLMTETGLDSKEPLKELVYSLAYGSELRNAETKLKAHDGIDADKAYRVMKHPVIRNMIRASQSQLRKIGKAGSVADAFGKELIVKDVAKSKGECEPKAKGARTKKARRSILASQAQSYEMALLAEAATLLIDSGLEILVWLHDGFIIKNTTRSKAIIADANLKVEQKANQLGIDTRLDIKTIMPD